jgi:hypothetical protein
MATLTKLQTVALSKVVKDAEYKKASAGLAAGEKKGEFVARVKYDLTKGEDFQQRIANKIDWTGLTAFALTKLNGVTIDALLTEFLQNNQTVDMEAIKAKAQETIDVIKGTTWGTSNGKITGDVEVEIIDLPEIHVNVNAK